ncbi:hypothetical protein L248_1961 [Schleiferilactobacillus shenzhenensis LY-73]|uniref:Uncharacterized protein n=1 Tax=Schleiferilactobacillus shenzhenensis LY-73 TaxID=1231336 RepID=U4TR06_9LACO|nr:hypothetical protein L248_1961 [Schleiferilactobacillus shenzhenensis LY-73]
MIKISFATFSRLAKSNAEAAPSSSNLNLNYARLDQNLD